MTHAPAIEVLRAAMTAARANDKPRTRELLVEATRLDPRNETAWQWLAGVAATPLEAVTALERVLALNPANEKARTAIGPARLQAGIVAAKAKDAPVARKLLRAVLAADPKNDTAWVWLASVAETPAEALAHLDRATAINPENAAAKRGIAYYQAKLAANSKGPSATSAAETLSARETRTDVRAVPGSPSTRTPPPAARPPAPAVRPRTILVVDDSPTVRKLAAMTLTAAGFRTVEAADGMDAVQKIRHDGPPDLILLDVTMPGMDGYEFCRLVRHTPDTRKVPVVMLTGKDGFFDKVRGRLAGTTAYLTKPLNPETLLKTVGKYCPTPSPT